MSSPSRAETCAAVTKGSLMGARGNSGVILSQILRGLCEVIGEAPVVDAKTFSAALDRSVEVAFQAVRKPVEGTMLTVLKDTAEAARDAAEADASVLDALEIASGAAFASVKRTPELLPVLKENGVVDAGGFGLAILLEGLVAAASGTEVRVADVSSAGRAAARRSPPSTTGTTRSTSTAPSSCCSATASRSRCSISSSRQRAGANWSWGTPGRTRSTCTPTTPVQCSPR